MFEMPFGKCVDRFKLKKPAKGRIKIMRYHCRFLNKKKDIILSRRSSLCARPNLL